jgi:hypothetical protein
MEGVMSEESVADTESGSIRVEKELVIENSIEIYKITADWIRFADAKAAVILTAGGVLAGVLIPHLKPYLEAVRKGEALAWLEPGVLACFGLWLGVLLLSAFYAFRCIVPFRQKGMHPALDFCKHFHSAAISVAYGADEQERFFETYRRLGHDKMLREVMSGLLIDAHISSSKYAFVTAAVKLLAVSSFFGFLFLFLSQF